MMCQNFIVYSFVAYFHCYIASLFYFCNLHVLFERANSFFMRTFARVHCSCRPLFASSLLGIVRTLLEQTQQDEMQILACSILIDFINGQVRNGYKVHLEPLD